MLCNSLQKNSHTASTDGALTLQDTMSTLAEITVCMNLASQHCRSWSCVLEGSCLIVLCSVGITGEFLGATPADAADIATHAVCLRLQGCTTAAIILQLGAQHVCSCLFSFPFSCSNVVAYDCADKYNLCNRWAALHQACKQSQIFVMRVSVLHCSEKDAAELVRTIVKVVAHCHSLGVIHR